MRDREAEFQNIVQIHLITEDKAWEKAWESQCQVRPMCLCGCRATVSWSRHPTGCSLACVLLLLMVGLQVKTLKERLVLREAQLVSRWLKRPICSAACRASPSI